jgi:hypothetical protein
MSRKEENPRTGSGEKPMRRTKAICDVRYEPMSKRGGNPLDWLK